MVADLVQEDRRHDVLVARDVERSRRAKPGLRAAYGLSGVIAVLMVVASAAGLLIDGLVSRWSLGSGGASRRGSDDDRGCRARSSSASRAARETRLPRGSGGLARCARVLALQLRLLSSFGAEFNDIFVLHIALFSLSIITLVLAVANVDVDAIAARFRGRQGHQVDRGIPRGRGSGPGRALGIPRDPLRDHR